MAEPAILKELGVEDLYGFLGVDSTASEKAITKGYRKKALQYHPDKNPGDEVAVAMFQKLSRIYSVLTDPAAKAAYDKWCKARDRVKKRNEELDSKRRKLKENLEKKESDHYTALAAEHEAHQQMKSEIERLREEGMEMARRQEELLRQTLNEADDDEVVLQITWNKRDAYKYTAEILEDMFSKYGHVDIVCKNKMALLSFTKLSVALNALQDIKADSSLQVKWISGEPVDLQWEGHRKRPSSGRDEGEGSCRVLDESAILNQLLQRQKERDRGENMATSSHRGAEQKTMVEREEYDFSQSTSGYSVSDDYENAVLKKLRDKQKEKQ